VIALEENFGTQDPGEAAEKLLNSVAAHHAGGSATALAN
jgi:hypothetical protein